jgi:predicted NBD/HSP70 family sugar kinase/transcriptional regulator with XRE-family HTH domain
MGSHPEDVEEADELDKLRSEVLGAEGEAAYRDAKRRAAMLATMVQTRKARGRTQAEVADAMGTTQSAVSEIESGRVDPQLRTLQRYAQALDVRLDLALVSKAVPAYDEGIANALWRQIERTAMSPLLSALMTNPDEERSVGDLARAARLPEELVLPMLTALQDRKWVSASGPKKKRMYDLRDDAAYTIGISIHRDAVTGVLINLRGGEAAQAATDLSSTSPSAVIETVVDVAARLYAHRGTHEVLSVGVCLAGVVIHETGEVKYAPDLETKHDAWSEVRLSDEIQGRLQARVADYHLLVAVENDANSLAMREYLMRGERCVVAVLISASGEGLGFGVVSDGNVVYGESCEAGEGGHVIVDPDGRPCRSGKHQGCLETVATPAGLMREAGLWAETGQGDVKRELAVLADRAGARDVKVVRAIEKGGSALGGFLATVMVLLNPSRVAVFGPSELMVPVEYASADVFTKSVDRGLLGGLSKDAVLGDRIEWYPLGDLTEAGAAGSAAMHWFLGEPAHWRPSALPSKTLDTVAG